jgi:leucyl-tRNA synthetase
LKYNTAIAAMMSLVNEFYSAGKVTKGEMKVLLILLNPVAPHITEELWSVIDSESRLIDQSWPEWDEKNKRDMAEIAVQVNGKVRGKTGAGCRCKSGRGQGNCLE